MARSANCWSWALICGLNRCEVSLPSARYSGVGDLLIRLQLIVGPDVLPRHRAVLQLGRVAQVSQQGRQVHLRALGERADPAVQETARRLTQRIFARRLVKPDHVQADRHNARHGEGREAAPADPPREHGDEDQDEQRLSHRPHQGRVPDEQPGEGHGQHRGPVAPAQQDHGEGDQEDEQRVGRDHVLKVQLVGVEQHRQRSQRRPPPGQPAAAQQGIGNHAEDDAHRGLQQPDHVVAVQREQEIEEEWIAIRPGHVRHVRYRVVNVVVGVAEPEDRRIGDDHDDAHHDGSKNDNGELPVRHDRADKPGERQVSLGRRLLTGNDQLASGGRVRQRPPPDS